MLKPPNDPGPPSADNERPIGELVHDRLEARPVTPERKSRVTAAIIELDALPDPVRPAAEDHDLLAVANFCFVHGIAEERCLIG